MPFISRRTPKAVRVGGSLSQPTARVVMLCCTDACPVGAPRNASLSRAICNTPSVRGLRCRTLNQRLVELGASFGVARPKAPFDDAPSLSFASTEKNTPACCGTMYNARMEPAKPYRQLFADDAFVTRATGKRTMKQSTPLFHARITKCIVESTSSFLLLNTSSRELQAHRHASSSCFINVAPSTQSGSQCLATINSFARDVVFPLSSNSLQS